MDTVGRWKRTVCVCGRERKVTIAHRTRSGEIAKKRTQRRRKTENDYIFPYWWCLVPPVRCTYAKASWWLVIVLVLKISDVGKNESGALLFAYSVFIIWLLFITFFLHSVCALSPSMWLMADLMCMCRLTGSFRVRVSLGDKAFYHYYMKHSKMGRT